ncbi:hypothetical protein PAMP_002185 [Pampus punctatissimus]
MSRRKQSNPRQIKREMWGEEREKGSILITTEIPEEKQLCVCNRNSPLPYSRNKVYGLKSGMIESGGGIWYLQGPVDIINCCGLADVS